MVLFKLDVLLFAIHELVLVLQVFGSLPLLDVLLLYVDLAVYAFLIIG